MRKVFIKDLAEARAKSLFTKDFFLTVTDSWYLDELFRFENKTKEMFGKNPRRTEKDYYMELMSNLFNSYEDKFYSGPLAQSAYGECINCFDKLLRIIEQSNKKFSQFNIDEDTIKKIKDLGNIFVYKHNEFCSQNNI